MYACTHAVVFAELRISDASHGVHGFMVQLRDEHGRLMPGVEVGEIGPKIIGGHTNIGYARFDRVRVPRFNMFSKLFKVTREGAFIAPPPKVGKIKNISMMMMRVFNVAWAARDTAKAATIACRYSCVRLQGFKDTTVPGGGGRGEQTIMDYRMQQLRTLSALSLAYMFFFNARYLDSYLSKVQNKITEGDRSAAEELPELHATCSGLKSFATTRGHAAIEECRKACGGQGFLRSSGIADLTCSFAEPVTVEGEQVILSLQVARFLIKSVRQLKAGETLKGSVEYLKEPPLAATDMAPATASGWTAQHGLLVAMLRDRASRQAIKLEARFDAAVLGGASFDEATNTVAIASYGAAMSHSAFVMSRNNLLAIEEFVGGEAHVAIRAALLRLAELRMLLFVQADAADWMGLLCEADLEVIFDRVNALLLEIRPDVVALTDAFGYTDYSLASTIGRADGNVYEAIYNEAKLSPLNQSPTMVGWEQLKPILDLDFIKKGVGQRWEPASKL